MINHATRFFKEIKRLEDALQAVEKDRPFGRTMVGEDGVQIISWSSHDSHEEDCIIREDGLWESKPESYGRETRKFVFTWRYHPCYCCAGMPYYSPKDVREFLEGSETEKVLYTHGEYELVWMWEKITMPTRIVWGMKPGPKFYQLRKNGKALFSSDVKKHFNERVKAEL